MKPWLLLSAMVFVCVSMDVHAQTRKRVMRLDALKVEGQIQKPQAFYILQRSDLSYETAGEKRSFIYKTLESAKKLPF